jgi:hypothetical protein
MANRKGRSPTLNLTITEKQWERARGSDSGGCLIADAIKEQYPHLSGISVDMATIGVTDKAAGERYVYLTPNSAQYLLLAFDQGWHQPVQAVRLLRAVRVTKVKASSAALVRKRAARLVELEERDRAGEELSKADRVALTKLRRTPPRPSNFGPVTDVIGGETPGRPATVVGGRPPVKGPAHPNLLRGRRRHFGVKTAQPGVIFADAVAEAVRLELSKDRGPDDLALGAS